MTATNTVRKFMLKKYPTNKYFDCPVPQHHWPVIQEYADQQTARLREAFLELINSVNHEDPEHKDHFIPMWLKKAGLKEKE